MGKRAILVRHDADGKSHQWDLVAVPPPVLSGEETPLSVLGGVLQRDQNVEDIEDLIATLPHHFDRDAEHEIIPADVPYLAAPVRDAISRGRRLKVGLAWRGNPLQVNDRRRSIPTEALAPLGEVEVEWFSLQKPAASPGFEVRDLTAELTDFSKTAALISQLDLVVSADTAVAHLAGALGKPTWVLLSKLCFWLYELDGESTPWYPSMKLFRQKRDGDWPNVIMRVADELRKTIS